jgi:hypothetical protein
MYNFPNRGLCSSSYLSNLQEVVGNEPLSLEGLVPKGGVRQHKEGHLQQCTGTRIKLKPNNAPLIHPSSRQMFKRKFFILAFSRKSLFSPLL